MDYKIGIPRSLLYHYYYPGWKEFFKKLGLEVVLSKKTNKKILEAGIKRTVDDLCLPLKSYFGHICQLKNKVDYIFTPRLISLGNYNSVCPKFMGLPDMVNSAFTKENLPPLITPDIDLRKGFFPWWKIARQVGDNFNISNWRVNYAFWKALKIQKKFETLKKSGKTIKDSIARLENREEVKKNNKVTINKQGNKNNLKIAVLGHSYLVNDEFLSLGLISKLKEFNVNVVTQEMIEISRLEKAAEKQSKKLFWYFNRHLMGGAYYFLEQDDIDGIIQVDAFGCGPDSMVKELVKIKGQDMEASILNVNLDEHSGEAGLETRLEAFIDLLERRKNI